MIIKNELERRRKISETKKRLYQEGKIIAWYKGKKRLPFSEEWKRNMSLANKGKHSSPNTEFKKGHISLRKGQKHSEESKKKQSETRNRLLKEGKIKTWNKNLYGKEYISHFKNGHPKGMKGKHSSEITREKLRKARAKMILPKYDTKIEVKIQSFLKELSYEFFTHQYIKIEHGYQCDILIPSMNLVIECDGNYWHKYPIGNDLDHIRTKELLEKGFKVLRLWEIEINEMDIDKFKELINQGENIIT